jgi:uncharacterized protein YkwD
MRADALAILLLFFSTASADALAEPAQLTVGPAPTCKERYNVETKFLANPDESVLIAGVIGWCRNNQVRMIWDERYATVARQWSGYLAKSGLDSAKMLPVDRLRFELHQQGVTDANITPFSVEGPPEKMPPEMRQFLDDEKIRARYTHFAVGVTRSPDQKKMVSTLLLGKRPALMDPVPVCPQPSSRLKLRMQLLKGYRHARWLLTTPKGEVQDDILIYTEGAWGGTLPLDSGKGTYQMEIVVHGPRGPEVAALFPLYVGVERPAIPTIKLHPAPARYRTPEDAETALLRLLNQERRRQGLPALTPDQKLCAVAREHSLQLLAERHAAHRTATTGSPLDRLRRSNIPFTRALENVSLSASPEAAHERFMESPGHRLNLLDPDVTVAGIGIAMERGSQEDILAVTEVFIEPIQSEAISNLAERITEMINRRRKSRGRFALGLDRGLSHAALRSARRLAALGSRADARHEGDALLALLTGEDQGNTGVQINYFKTANHNRVLAARGLLDEDINRIGIGLAKPPNQSVPGELWIAVIFAGR